MRIIARACNICTFPDLSHTQAHDQGHLDVGTTGWEGPTPPILQGEISEYLGSRGTFFSPTSQGPSLQTIDPAFPPSGELCSPSMMQDFIPYATSRPPGQVHDSTQSHMGTHRPNTTTHASQLREKKAEGKKEKDRLNKRDHRSRNAEDFWRICALLKIPLKPKNWLAHRSKCLRI